MGNYFYNNNLLRINHYGVFFNDFAIIYPNKPTAWGKVNMAGMLTELTPSAIYTSEMNDYEK